jgi:hypothetical protein
MLPVRLDFFRRKLKIDLIIRNKSLPPMLKATRTKSTDSRLIQFVTKNLAVLTVE